MSESLDKLFKAYGFDPNNPEQTFWSSKVKSVFGMKFYKGEEIDKSKDVEISEEEFEKVFNSFNKEQNDGRPTYAVFQVSFMPNAFSNDASLTVLIGKKVYIAKGTAADILCHLSNLNIAGGYGFGITGSYIQRQFLKLGR